LNLTRANWQRVGLRKRGGALQKFKEVRNLSGAQKKRKGEKREERENHEELGETPRRRSIVRMFIRRVKSHKE